MSALKTFSFLVNCSFLEVTVSFFFLLRLLHFCKFLGFYMIQELCPKNCWLRKCIFFYCSWEKIQKCLAIIKWILHIFGVVRSFETIFVWRLLSYSIILNTPRLCHVIGDWSELSNRWKMSYDSVIYLSLHSLWISKMEKRCKFMSINLFCSRGGNRIEKRMIILVSTF